MPIALASPSCLLAWWYASILGPRVSFLFLCSLFLGAGVPLALGWARAIPSEDPDEVQPIRKAAILLLFLVTLSFAAKLPGIPAGQARSLVAALLPAEWVPWVFLAGRGLLAAFPGVAVIYSVARPHSLARPLFWAGILVTFLWLLAPRLLAGLLRA